MLIKSTYRLIFDQNFKIDLIAKNFYELVYEVPFM